MPLFFYEIIIFTISVRHAIKYAERIHFRILRFKIQTDDQNSEMFSTDDEDMSFDSSQSESNHSGVLLNKDIGGPYHVEFVKPWKPVIVVYIDAIFAITYFTVVVLHYWTQIGINA